MLSDELGRETPVGATPASEAGYIGRRWNGGGAVAVELLGVGVGESAALMLLVPLGNWKDEGDVRSSASRFGNPTNLPLSGILEVMVLLPALLLSGYRGRTARRSSWELFADGGVGIGKNFSSGNPSIFGGRGDTVRLCVGKAIGVVSCTLEARDVDLDAIWEAGSGREYGDDSSCRAVGGVSGENLDMGGAISGIAMCIRRGSRVWLACVVPSSNRRRSEVGRGVGWWARMVV